MSFSPKALVNIVTCRHCKGEGCNFCQNQGVYGEMEGQSLFFEVPLYLAVKERKQAKQLFMIKKVLLFLTCALLIYFIWKLLLLESRF